MKSGNISKYLRVSDILIVCAPPIDPFYQTPQRPAKVHQHLAKMSAPEDALGWLQLARTLAREAGDMVLAMRKLSPSSAAPALNLETKSASSDLVTSADRASQRHIFSGIKKQYPSHRLIGEEDATPYGMLDARPTWIVDAIDGTTNYIHDISEFSVSIAFVLNKTTQVGVVYAPKSGELYHAVVNRGSFCNDLRLSTSATTTLSRAIIISEWGYIRGAGRNVDKMVSANRELLARDVRGVRQLGSGCLDLCYVGHGRADGVYCGVAGEGWHVWDYAAGALVATEAGAEIRRLDGGPFDMTGDSMVCATAGVLAALVGAVRERF